MSQVRSVTDIAGLDQDENNENSRTASNRLPLRLCRFGGRHSQKALLCKSFPRARFEISLETASRCFISNRHIRAKNQRQVLARGDDMPLLMRCNSTSEIVSRADIDVAVVPFEEVDVPHVATVSLRSFGASGDTLRPVVSGWPATRSPQGETARRRCFAAMAWHPLRQGLPRRSASEGGWRRGRDSNPR
jgi:hypothetical protein